MAQILRGEPVANAIKEEIIKVVAEAGSKGVITKMAIVRVGERPDDLAYEKRVLKNCQALGIEVEVFPYPDDISMESFEKAFRELNQDNLIHGILLFRPLPNQLDDQVIQNLMAPEKDIDCMNPVNLDRIFHGATDGMRPCTPEAIIEILKFYQIKLEGKKAVVINRSMVLGKPLAMMLLSENATVTICHSKTRNMKEITRQADIIITGVGRAGHFEADDFSEHAVILDAGINFAAGKMCGDVQFDQAEQKVAAITPVPGGIGPVTSMILLRHVADAAERIGK